MNLSKKVCDEACHLLDAAMKKNENCVKQLTNEQIWWRPGQDLCSIGNLLLHITGNLTQWGIAPITGEPDTRDRAAEFDSRLTLGRDVLMAKVRNTVAKSKSLFQTVSEDDLLRAHQIQGFDVTLMTAILHTSTHFVGHTHQVILLTRMQLGEKYEFEWSPESGRDFLPI